jgi:putative transposase
MRTQNEHSALEKKQYRQPPMPWNQFIASHMESLVACDFFTKSVHTVRGKFDAYVLTFIHLGSRKVFCTPATFNPDERWIMQQARNAAMWMQDEGIQPMMLLMDHDTKFTAQFRYFWKKAGVRPKRLPVGAPDANAYCESFFSRLKGECLNHFVIFSLSQMDYVVQTWVDHLLHERPHRGKGIGNRVLDPNFQPQTKGTVCCRERLGDSSRAITARRHRRASPRVAWRISLQGRTRCPSIRVSVARASAKQP